MATSMTRTARITGSFLGEEVISGVGFFSSDTSIRSVFFLSDIYSASFSQGIEG